VIGALIGRQEGRNIEVMNSFELLSHTMDGHVLIDKEYYYTKEEQCEGGAGGPGGSWAVRWGAGDGPGLHLRGCLGREGPVGLSCPPAHPSCVILPPSQATMLFAELTYTLATEEAERIGVDHVARMTATGSGENSTVAEHLIAQHSAIKMLHSRVKLILEYVRASEAGEVPFNHEILREAYALCHCLPVLSTDKFKTDFYDQCNDVGLMAYLGTITKTCNTMNQFVNKFNILYDRQGIGRRMRGLFF
ncbi:CSN6 protein, partial [Fregata magnificens]|nr:CSN6 protein [Fregata magnificens]